MHAQKKSPHFLSGGETHLLLIIVKVLAINRSLHMCKYHIADFFKKMVEQCASLPNRSMHSLVYTGILVEYLKPEYCAHLIL